MPISHPLRAIFVHIPKTGGTSVEAALGMHGDRHDIGLKPYFNQIIDLEHLYGRDLQHMTAAELEQRLGDRARFECYFKFAIVRNPWERLVSTLAWTNQKWARGEPLERAEFTRAVRELHAAFCRAGRSSAALASSTHLRPQALFTIDGASLPCLDYIARHESLASDWDRICERLEISAPLPVRMKSHHGPYRDYYDAETRAMVGEMYDEDVRCFHYEF